MGRVHSHRRKYRHQRKPCECTCHRRGCCEGSRCVVIASCWPAWAFPQTQPSDATMSNKTSTAKSKSENLSTAVYRQCAINDRLLEPVTPLLLRSLIEAWTRSLISRAMDPFRRFPPEIMQQIIIHTADFVAVENLSSASPWANAVFHAQPRAITADLIASNPITATPETQRLIRDTVILYTPSIHCRSLGEFQQTWKNKNGLLSDLLPQQITATETLRLIPVAAKIQRIACITRDHIASLRPARTLAWTEPRLHWALRHPLRYSILRKTAQRRWGWTAELIMEIGDMKSRISTGPSSLLASHGRSGPSPVSWRTWSMETMLRMKSRATARMSPHGRPANRPHGH